MPALIAGELGQLLLLEYVFLEVVTVVLARRGLQAAACIGKALLTARELEFVPCSDVFVEAWETFLAQSAGALSFADAAIVTVARRADDRRIATFDADFERFDDLVVIPEPQ